MGVFSLTAGCVFLMWLGEQIDEYGLGNGASLIIMAGIVARMPAAIMLLMTQTNFDRFRRCDQADHPGQDRLPDLCLRVRGCRLHPDYPGPAANPDPAGQADTRPRVYGGARQYLPLAGKPWRRDADHLRPVAHVVPQHDALPRWRSLSKWGVSLPQRPVATASAFLYIITEVVLIYFFAYFWTTVQFQPKEMANQLRDYGSFIPGLRPGPRTATTWRR